MKASNELKEFLQDWLSWAEDRNSGYIYDDHVGLCHNSDGYDTSYILHTELMILFNYDAYPFGKSAYKEHQDPNRLAWVKAALNDTLDTWELVE